VHFLTDLIHRYEEENEPIPLYFCYDDACHLVGRILSLIGTCWEIGLMSTLVIALDKFHMINHINGNCLKELHPAKYPRLWNLNSQSAEQTNSVLVKYARMVVQKNEGSYRFFTLRVVDLMNTVAVKKDRSDIEKKLRPEKNL
jgi:hypothetical protein